MKIHDGWRPVSGIFHKPRKVTSDVQARLRLDKKSEMGTFLKGGTPYHIFGIVYESGQKCVY